MSDPEREALYLDPMESALHNLRVCKQRDDVHEAADDKGVTFGTAILAALDDIGYAVTALSRPEPVADVKCLTCGVPVIDAMAGCCHECGATDGHIGTQWLRMPLDQRPLPEPEPVARLDEALLETAYANTEGVVRTQRHNGFGEPFWRIFAREYAALGEKP